MLGEELLFRGFLLPRMHRAFGRADWLANGVLFAAYHVHVPWVMPSRCSTHSILAYPAQRYRSAWIGIIVHSSQVVFIAPAGADVRRLSRSDRRADQLDQPAGTLADLRAPSRS